MCGNLEELSKLSRDLALSSTQPCPEEYIKQTLIAHGFFKHSKSTSSQIFDNESQLQNATDGDDKGRAQCGISEEDKRRTTQLISLVREGREVHRLKEPRNLYPHASHNLSPRNLPLWPLEVLCVRQDVKFEAGLPSGPELFLRQETEVLSPKIRSINNGGTVVYSNPLGPEKYFTSSRSGPTPGLISPSPSPDSTALVFESRFESGNLAKAVQVGRWDYELYLRFDLYTNKHTQWFYFSVSNMRKGQAYRFTIVNLYKAGSLYNEGMQPVMYSVGGARETGVGWRRAGYSIKYFKTNIRRPDTRCETYHYGLTWSYRFEYEQDTCYFAHCYPYTYSDLQDYVSRLASDSRTAGFVKLRTLCHSVAGNSIPVLAITAPVKSQSESRAKRAVVLTARVHPGETNGSWMMKGFLDFITGQSPDAKVLRDNFVFKVVPMLNPDGVIVGNYRCSLAGRDLNRNYRSKLKDSYPIIWHTKAMVKKLAEAREIVLYCDFHGHSKKQNVFIYGCDLLEDPHMRLKSRVFPKMLSKNAPAMFSYKDSRFNVHKSKEGTGRVVMWREMGVANSYTMEATFCGSTQDKMAGVQFTTRDLEAMGYHFCDTLLDYCDPDQTKVECILHDLREECCRAVLERLASLGRSVPPGVDPLDLMAELSSDEESSDLGSDSSESDGPPVSILAQEARKKKKKKLKSRRERNKHKALLKLTHSTVKAPAVMPTVQPSHQEPIMIPTAALEDTVLAQSKRAQVSVVEVPRHSQLELQARNGGIPTFVQERIEERLKRRSEIDVNKTDPETEYMEAVALEYMRQGVSGGLVQEVSQQDPRKSLSLLSQPLDCPISITSMALRENKPPTRPSSRLGKRPSLPQLATEERGAPTGAFASQYVANHLVRDPARPSSPTSGPSGQGEESGVNHTKSLANLSRLFRQLKPQPLHSEGARSKLTGSLRPEESAVDGSDDKFHMPSRVKFQSGVEETRFQSLTISSQNLSDKSLSGSDGLAGAKSFSKPDHQSKKRTGASTKSGGSKPIVKPPITQDPSDGTLTAHDRKVLAEVRPAVGGNPLKSNSPMTSSWESFTSPKELSSRREEEASRLVSERDLRQSEFDPKIPRKTDLSEPAIRYDILLKSLGIKQPKHAPHIPKSESAPVPETPALIPPVHTSTTHHSRHSSNHLPTTKAAHSQTSSRSTQKPTNNQLPSSIRPVGNQPAASRATEHRAHGSKDKTHTTVKTHKRQVADAVDKIHQKREGKKRRERGSRSVEGVASSVSEYPTLEQVVHGDREVPTRGREQLVEEKGVGSQPVSDNFIPVTSSRMFSSKPPSRYGPKPKSDNGVTPATVSLMLGKRHKPRPSTMYSSLRPRRPLLVRYYTKAADDNT